MKLLVEKLNPEATLPSLSYKGDAGFNIFSAEKLVLNPGEKAAVKTGWKLAIPAGYAGFVWDKSGLAVKNHIKTMAGVIDSNYRGELLVVLTNLGKEPYHIEKGIKIAQLIIHKVETLEIKETVISDETERGKKGF